jgi:hypothetical protein
VTPVVAASRIVAGELARANAAVETAQALLLELNGEQKSLDTLAWAIDKPKETVRRHVNAFVDVGLAKRKQRGWVAAWAPDVATEARAA